MSVPQKLPPLEMHELQAIQLALTQCKALVGPLLEVLHAIQQRLGFVPPAAVPIIAQELNLSRAEVHGVVTFYHHFRQHAAARHVVQICRAEACQAMGAEALAQHATARLRTAFHDTSADGEFTLEPVYCFGNCALGPAVCVDGTLYGRVDSQRFDELIAMDGHGKADV